MTGEVVLRQWVIYERPRDYPQDFVVREWLIVRGSSPQPTINVRLAPTLEQARACVPRGLFCIPRSPGDDAVIVETWT